MTIAERLVANLTARHADPSATFPPCWACSPDPACSGGSLCAACACDMAAARERAKAEEAAGAAALQAREDAIREADLRAEADADAHRRDAERPCCGAAADKAKRDGWAAHAVPAGIGSMGAARRVS